MFGIVEAGDPVHVIVADLVLGAEEVMTKTEAVKTKTQQKMLKRRMGQTERVSTSSLRILQKCEYLCRHLSMFFPLCTSCKLGWVDGLKNICFANYIMKNNKYTRELCSPPVQLVRLARMHHFLSLSDSCLPVLDQRYWKKIHTSFSESIIAMSSEHVNAHYMHKIHLSKKKPCRQNE